MERKIDFKELKDIIKNADVPGPPLGSNYKPTSVFLLVFGRDPHILAILKSNNKGYPWSNQVALPGGHVEKNDSRRLDTAFRELSEELNITKDQVALIGSVGHFQTISDRDIKVFVGLWNEKGPVISDSKEIAKVLRIPLKSLVKTHIKEKFHNHLPGVDELKYNHNGTIIWGVTAKIIHFFIELVYPLLDKKGCLREWKNN